VNRACVAAGGFLTPPAGEELTRPSLTRQSPVARPTTHSGSDVLTRHPTQCYSCVMIPAFDVDRSLPPGIHQATWPEFAARFGTMPHGDGCSLA